MPDKPDCGTNGHNIVSVFTGHVRVRVLDAGVGGSVDDGRMTGEVVGSAQRQWVVRSVASGPRLGFDRTVSGRRRCCRRSQPAAVAGRRRRLQQEGAVLRRETAYRRARDARNARIRHAAQVVGVSLKNKPSTDQLLVGQYPTILLTELSHLLWFVRSVRRSYKRG